MKLRVYIKSMDNEFYKNKFIKQFTGKWHNVISIWFNDDETINHIAINDGENSVSTIFATRTKMKLEMDGNIIWEN